MLAPDLLERVRALELATGGLSVLFGAAGVLAGVVSGELFLAGVRR